MTAEMQLTSDQFVDGTNNVEIGVGQCQADLEIEVTFDHTCDEPVYYVASYYDAFIDEDIEETIFLTNYELDNLTFIHLVELTPAFVAPGFDFSFELYDINDVLINDNNLVVNVNDLDPLTLTAPTSLSVDPDPANCLGTANFNVAFNKGCNYIAFIEYKVLEGGVEISSENLSVTNNDLAIQSFNIIDELPVGDYTLELKALGSTLNEITTNPSVVSLSVNPVGGCTLNFVEIDSNEDLNSLSLQTPEEVKEIDKAYNIPGFKPEATFRFYPNPARNNVLVNFTSVNEESVLNIYDLTGRLIQTEIIQRGTESVEIDLSGFEFSNGLYLIEAKIGENTFVEKLIIQK